jgi:hypothetical protein
MIEVKEYYTRRGTLIVTVNNVKISKDDTHGMTAFNLAKSLGLESYKIYQEHAMKPTTITEQRVK